MDEFLAAIDIGSNALRLAIARLNERGQCEVLSTKKAFLQLGREVQHGGEITQASQQRLQQVLTRFKQEIQPYPNCQIQCVATSALRRAHNRNQVVQHIDQSLQLAIQLIDGHEESTLLRQAVLALIPEIPKPAVLVDLGGGSLETSWIDPLSQPWGFSQEVGAFGLLQAFEQGNLVPCLDEVVNTIDLNLRQHGVQSGDAVNSIVYTGGSAKNAIRIWNQFFQPVPPGNSYICLDQALYESHREQLLHLNVEELVESGLLRREQAELAAPAFHLIDHLGRWLKAGQYYFTWISLKDGLLIEMARRLQPEWQVSLVPLPSVLQQSKDSNILNV